MKKILITGANSYIGDSVKDYLMQYPDEYVVNIVDTIGLKPSPDFFSEYDVVFNVAGIAHIKETDENRHLYYEVNRDLSVEIAKAAKAGGVKQFILLSTMSVYGKVTGHITKETPENPFNAYGKSKLEADNLIKELEDDSFRFACIRPPMVYGKGCKGNYQKLRKFALVSPIFPNIKNRRSMIFIGNLCAFIKYVVDSNQHGIFHPENAKQVNTSELVKLIAINHGKSIRFISAFNWILLRLRNNTLKKVFGSLNYNLSDPVDEYSFIESISMTENDISVSVIGSNDELI